MEDDDYVDEVTVENVKGLRKYGPSKEHRPNPIVEMGLFMDRNGLPLSMCITSDYYLFQENDGIPAPYPQPSD